jgi:hypothetical protein
MRARNIFFILVILSVLVFSGCKKECSQASDCAVKTCNTVSCVKNACVYASKSNCCGNGKCDTIENKCTCEKDCKACSGNIGKFMFYTCVNEECVAESNRLGKTILDEHKFTYFSLGITSSYEEPFDLAKSGFTMAVALKDADVDLVPPVRITSVKLLEKDVLLGQASPDISFSSVGDSQSVGIPLSFEIPGNESSKTITYKIDYEYVKRIRGSYNSETGDYDYTNSQVIRETYTKTFTAKINFIDSSKI